MCVFLHFVVNTFKFIAVLHIFSDEIYIFLKIRAKILYIGIICRNMCVFSYILLLICLNVVVLQYFY